MYQRIKAYIDDNRISLNALAKTLNMNQSTVLGQVKGEQTLSSMLAGYLNFGWGVTINGETINIAGAIVSILANGFAGYGFVYCGAYVAPRYKGVTALLLMIVLVIGVIFGIYQDFTLGRVTILETVELLVNPIGSYIVFESIKEDVAK